MKNNKTKKKKNHTHKQTNKPKTKQNKAEQAEQSKIQNFRSVTMTNYFRIVAALTL